MAKPILQIRVKAAAGDKDIDDLGITLLDGSPGAARNLTDEFGYARLADSDDLYSLIDTGYAGVECSDNATFASGILTEAQALEILQSFSTKDHTDLDGTNPHSVDAGDIGADAIVTELNANATSTIDKDNLDSDLIDSSELSSAISGFATTGDVSTAISTHEGEADPHTGYAKEADLVAPSSGVNVDYTNIVNAPSPGEGQYPPVDLLVIDAEAASAPTTSANCAAAAAEYYIDAATDHLWKSVTPSSSVAWVDQGAVATGFRVIDLNVSTEDIREYGRLSCRCLGRYNT